MSLAESYRMRLRRRHRRLRARLRGRELRLVRDRTAVIAPEDHLCVSVLRNERLRLPYFLDYHRRLGIRHFLLVDNGSEDGTGDYLAAEPDVSLWHAAGSYAEADFGVDWANWLLSRHGHGHWCLTVDVDEFLVYPFCDTRPLAALTDWLSARAIRTFAAMLVDMYPKGPLGAVAYGEGQDPFEIAAWFDAGNHVIEPSPLFRNLWIQGGVRARSFFADAPALAPALNKVPLVRWRRAYSYASSTHMLLPRGLNLAYDIDGGEKAAGALLHAKFLPTFPSRAAEEAARSEHYQGGSEYRAYAAGLDPEADLWCPHSARYAGWRQLDALGLISTGGWA